ncbi:molybdenum cofactor guanylyltransferase MobA [Trinickia dabaoshanensis]|uniref:Molybdenum cofactor guanylyltransferase n=1 Tax=Trinickia dabaoshanensis TaxID=564714 RepID=A0A2N7VQI6_9BURK|nr:molybdenum cofactor guanylyltransferase MobA [Trinickia dabaoshanensis]PMS19439.1 molybdenum cofactor guanylyltransferase MobA [Trinickia dabaoshanensis]
MDPLARKRITGLVLAGGRGTRMGGLDKGLQLLAGVPLAAHVVERIAPQADALLISANRHLDDYARLGAPHGARVITDASADFPGPLAGLLAGLRACSTELLLCAPCDTPCLPSDLAARLLAALDAEQADVAVAGTADGAGHIELHPVIALVRRALADDLAAYLNAGERKVRTWYGRHKQVEVPFRDEGAFYNANSLHELADLARTIEARPGHDRHDGHPGQ